MERRMDDGWRDFLHQRERFHEQEMKTQKNHSSDYVVGLRARLPSIPPPVVYVKVSSSVTPYHKFCIKLHPWGISTSDWCTPGQQGAACEAIYLWGRCRLQRKTHLISSWYLTNIELMIRGGHLGLCQTRVLLKPAYLSCNLCVSECVCVVRHINMFILYELLLVGINCSPWSLWHTQTRTHICLSLWGVFIIPNININPQTDRSREDQKIVLSSIKFLFSRMLVLPSITATHSCATVLSCVFTGYLLRLYNIP